MPGARPPAALALLLVLALLVAGCASSDRRGSAAAAKGVVIGTTDTITSLDPGNAYEFLPTNILWNTEATLLTYRLDSAGSQPELATAAPDVSADGLAYTFHLRPGLRYSDGSAVKAGDFLWALDRNSGKVGGQEGGPAFLIYDSPGVDLANSSAPDAQTLVLKLDRPGVFFSSLIVFPNFAPLPRSQYTKAGWVEPTGGTADLPVSSGPYQIVEYRPNEFLRLARNPYYQGPRAAHAESVTIKFYSSSASLKAAVLNGEVDVAYRTFSAGDWADLKDRAGRGLRTVEVPGPSPLRFLAFQVQKAPFNDARVREALALLVDRDEIARVAYRGSVTPAYSIVPKGLGFQGQKDSFLEQYGQAPDPDRARLLLQEVGYSEDNKLAFDLWFNSDEHYGAEEPDLATLLKAEFERSNMVQVHLQSKQWVAYKADFRNGLLPVFLIGWFPDYLDPDDYIAPFLTPGGAASFGTYYQNDTASQLIAQEEAEGDAGVRAALLGQLQDTAAQDLPMVPLFTGKVEVAAKSSVQGLTMPPHQLLPYFTLGV